MKESFRAILLSQWFWLTLVIVGITAPLTIMAIYPTRLLQVHVHPYSGRIVKLRPAVALTSFNGRVAYIDWYADNVDRQSVQTIVLAIRRENRANFVRSEPSTSNDGIIRGVLQLGADDDPLDDVTNFTLVVERNQEPLGDGSIQAVATTVARGDSRLVLGIGLAASVIQILEWIVRSFLSEAVRPTTVATAKPDRTGSTSD